LDSLIKENNPAATNLSSSTPVMITAPCNQTPKVMAVNQIDSKE